MNFIQASRPCILPNAIVGRGSGGKLHNLLDYDRQCCDAMGGIKQCCRIHEILPDAALLKIYMDYLTVWSPFLV